MHNPQEQSGFDSHVLTEEQSEDATEVRYPRYIGAATITIGDVDLPAYVSHGEVYVQAPLSGVFEAFAEDLPDFLRDLEVRISASWGPPLSLDSDGRAFYRTPMGSPRVGGSGEQR